MESMEAVETNPAPLVSEPPSSATPGGSYSNFLAVYLARKAAEARHGADVIPRLAYFVSRAGHYSIPKGADFVGVPRGAMVEVPTDDSDRMHPDQMAWIDSSKAASVRTPTRQTRKEVLLSLTHAPVRIW